MDDTGPRTSRAWPVTAVVGGLATVAAVTLAVAAHWYWPDAFEEGWPERAGWWAAAVSATGSSLVVVLVAGAVHVRTPRRLGALALLAIGLGSLLVSGIGWARSASQARESRELRERIVSCSRHVRSLETKDLADAPISSVLFTSNSSLGSLVMQSDFGGYQPKGMQEKLERRWSELRADRLRVERLCTSWLAEQARDAEDAGNASVNLSYTQGRSVDVTVE